MSKFFEFSGEKKDLVESLLEFVSTKLGQGEPPTISMYRELNSNNFFIGFGDFSPTINGKRVAKQVLFSVRNKKRKNGIKALSMFMESDDEKLTVKFCEITPRNMTTQRTSIYHYLNLFLGGYKDFVDYDVDKKKETVTFTKNDKYKGEYIKSN